MNKDEARSAVMGAISMALKDPTLQLGFELICKEIADLTKENAELKEELKAIDKAGEHVRQQINDAFRNKKPYWELEKENEELKNRNQELLESCEGAEMMYKDLQKAQEIIKRFLAIGKITQNYLDVTKEAEHFLKVLKGCEVENEKKERADDKDHD